ncbi:hypothetical protein MNV84_05682 [Leishmania braziliensis]|nr:hypothetical protein MNV84_05682 [Leishmania braziliensis]
MLSSLKVNPAAARMACGAATRHCRLSSWAKALSFAITLALFCALCCEVSALEIGNFLPGHRNMDAMARFASVKALQALQRAIDDPELQIKVMSALMRTTDGFDMCQSALYRCNSVTGALEEAVIKDMRNGTVKWSEYPKSVKRIRITDSRLSQPLVLSSLPANLEEFLATNVEWQSNSILQNPPSDANSLTNGGLAQLRVLQCNQCALVKAEVTTTSPQLASLHVLSLSGNPNLTVDLRDLPRTLHSLELSHTQLVHPTAKEVLKAAPAFLSRLNISFTGVALTFDMLRFASTQLKMLDVSGLGSGDPKSPLSVSQLQKVCSESDLNPEELYLTSCNLTGILPDLRNCAKLKVVDVSHNLLEGAAFAELPKMIESLHLNNNAMQGTLRTQELPRTLRFLDLSANQFTGQLNLSELPKKLEYFDISHNRFTGNVNLTQLPEPIKYVFIQHNNFTGVADLIDIPLGIRYIMIHHNDWDYRMPAS